MENLLIISSIIAQNCSLKDLGAYKISNEGLFLKKLIQENDWDGVHAQ